MKSILLTLKDSGHCEMSLSGEVFTPIEIIGVLRFWQRYFETDAICRQLDDVREKRKAAEEDPTASAAQTPAGKK